MLATLCVLVLMAVSGETGLRAGAVPGAQLPRVRVRQYTMSGAVRPLLFWISRDNVGLARITWRQGEGGARGYEFLVGTDPARAPRSINRWGYIAEEVGGIGGSVLALMLGSPDTSYDAEAGPSVPAGGVEFRAMRGNLRDGAATWQSAKIVSPSLLTVHDLDKALEHVSGRMINAPWREAAVARNNASTQRGAGAPCPGFLAAIAESIDRAISPGTRDRRARLSGAMPYVFGRETYELAVRDMAAVTIPHAGRPTPALRLAFESRALSTGSRTRFEVTCATSDDLAGVPLIIEWQPRWWLRATLRLDA